MKNNCNVFSSGRPKENVVDQQNYRRPGCSRRFRLFAFIVFWGSLYGADALAGCSSNNPSSNTTVTCTSAPPNPDTQGVAGGTGFFAKQNITVNVESGAEIATSGRDGIQVTRGSSVVNRGIVRTSGNFVNPVNFTRGGIFMDGTNTLRNEAGASIIASGANNPAAIVGGTRGKVVIVNAGTLTGPTAINLGGFGLHEVTLVAPTSVVNGFIIGGGGNGSTFTLGGTGDASIDQSTVSGFANRFKDGSSTWTLTGNTPPNRNRGLFFDWTVKQGTLAVNGVVGDVTVNPGGVLGGTGTVGQTTIAGTLAPGNSIGTLTVNGNLTFQSGSRYQVELDENGNSDRTNVNGAVTLGGAGLDLIEHQGAYQRVTNYEIISNDGGDAVIGAFGPITENLLFLDPTVNTAGGDGNDVVLTLSRNDLPFCGVGGSGNHAAVCKALDIAAAQGLLPTIESHLLSHISEEGARNSYDSLSGASHASFSSAMFEAHRLFALTVNQRTVEQRLWQNQPSYAAAGGDAGESADSGAWLRGIGLVTGKIDDDVNAPGLSYQIGGVATGYDVNLADIATVGVAAGYTYTSAEFDRFNNTSNVNSYQAGAYGAGSAGPVNLYGMLGYAYQDVNTTRNIQVGNQFRRTANANYGGNLLSTYAEASMPLVPAKSVVIEPLVSVFYVHRWREDFTETGAGAANLVVNSEAEDSLRSLVGARASMLIETDIGTVIPQIRARWEHEYLDTGAQVNTTFAGAPNIAAFNVQGVKVARDSALIGTGISLFQHQGLALQLDYDLRINADQVENLLSAGVSYAF